MLWFSPTNILCPYHYPVPSAPFLLITLFSFKCPNVLSSSSLHLIAYASYEVPSGMRLNDTSWRSSPPARICPPRTPRSATRVLRNSANLNLVRTCFTTFAYVSFLFLAIICANFLLNLLHSGERPPDVVNTSGTNDAFSIWMTRSLYFLFFSSLWCLYISSNVLS